MLKFWYYIFEMSQTQQQDQAAAALQAIHWRTAVDVQMTIWVYLDKNLRNSVVTQVRPSCHTTDPNSDATHLASPTKFWNPASAECESRQDEIGRTAKRTWMREAAVLSDGVGEATGLKLPNDRCAAEETLALGRPDTAPAPALAPEPPPSSAWALCMRLKDLASSVLGAACLPLPAGPACWDEARNLCDRCVGCRGDSQ